MIIHVPFWGTAVKKIAEKGNKKGNRGKISLRVNKGRSRDSRERERERREVLGS